jgi:signal transduction histidine kinase/HAMP domain-containing protein
VKPLERGLAAAPWACPVLLAAWTAWPHPLWLGAAAVSVVASLRPAALTSRRATVAKVAVLAAVAVGLWGQGRDRRLAREFETYWEERLTAVFEILEQELADLLDRGIRAATTLASRAASGNPPTAAEVARLRRETGMTALALYGPGEPPRGMEPPSAPLALWDGVHRGRVPEAIQLGRAAYLYSERPLVSYFYVGVPVEGGGTAVAAQLLRADLPTGAAPDRDFAARMRARTGERIAITSPERADLERAEEGEVFDFASEAGVHFSVSLVRPRESERRAAELARTRRAVAVLLLGAWLLLALAAPAGPRRGWAAAASGLAIALLLPVPILPGIGRLAAPADVLLPFAPGATLGRLALVLAALVVLAGVARPVTWPGNRPALGAALVAVAFPVTVLAMESAASTGFLAGPGSPWLAYVVVVAGWASLVAWAALVLARRPGQRRVRVAVGLALVAGLVLAGSLVAAWRPGYGPAWLALWAAPLVVLRPAGPRGGAADALLAWSLALVLGTSAVLPHAWGSRLVARMEMAEAQVGRLGTRVDPHLQFLMERTASAADSLDRRGAGPVELLYESWHRGGLADAGYAIFLTLWSAGDVPQEELRVGFGPGNRPDVALGLLEEARDADTVLVRRYELPDAHYAVAVPLGGGRIVTGVVPPLRGAGGGPSLLGPLFGSLGTLQEDPVTMIPLLPSDVTTPGDSLRWERAGQGWQGELVLSYPGIRYHAHYRVPLPGGMVALARGTLVLAFILGALGLLWGLGRRVGDREARRDGMLRLVLASFRARVTFVLFAFFLLSNLIFGSLAYRTIAGASQRAARVLAERAANDAADTYSSVAGEILLLSRLVGTDLLEYRGGELREGSVEELVELGLYEGWVPFEVDRALDARESMLEVATTDLGAWEYVTAYRRLPDGDVVGAPVPLQAGATAVRSREVAHLLAFAVLLGAGLSLVLALLVGRTLARPIQTLRVASERVGSGNLSVRLPGDRLDEFGAVFEAFNRMVRRLRHARRALVRTSRRTQAVVEDVATGVLAFDQTGVVTLVNPRAHELLALPLQVGQRLAPIPGAEGELVHWIELYFRDGLREATTDLQTGARRIRVRARRIGRGQTPGGAVVSLEDVTDELRTERVLAWGEMARQVAHEVKNPLTPIKLSVQHIRRAWEDRRPDFGDILTRNADAMLREIDRLAAIAAGFSRLGAPGAGGEQPIGPVRLGEVVDEVMALYVAGEGPIRFVADVPAELPPAAARAPEVKEVLINLLENARAAIQEEGTVRVAGRSARDAVVLTVSDDGAGVPAAMLPRIFEPHFSTRSTGTGLGLAIVQRLVDAWGATVSVESEEGQGTVVTIRFRPSIIDR